MALRALEGCQTSQLPTQGGLVARFAVHFPEENVSKEVCCGLVLGVGWSRELGRLWFFLWAGSRDPRRGR